MGDRVFVVGFKFRKAAACLRMAGFIKDEEGVVAKVARAPRCMGNAAAGLAAYRQG